MATIETKLMVPKVPNFIIHETEPGRRQDGFKEAAKTSIGDLTDEQLRDIGKEWTEALIAHAISLRVVKAT